jgi:hypothetical protein
VRPVWSPDSTKAAAAFDTQIRIYDALRNVPTQAAIPLKNQLLISSQAYDRQLQQSETDVNANAGANTQSVQTPGQAASTLPDPATLVSFSPIVELVWASEELLYFRTGYVKEYKDASNNRRSYMRWHRLVLTPQPQPAVNR